MVEIIFEAHGTTFDNEAKIASGWNDVGLSDLGERQARELGERHKGSDLDAVFCSDLKRAYETAEIAFKNRDTKIIQDARLRECDYGDMTGSSEEKVKLEKPNRVFEPFSNGESYEQTSERMKKFLLDLLRDYNGKKVMIIGHRATQYGLEHWLKNIPLKEAVTAPWKWQPGWRYLLEKI
jgi:broad specificity phosphatase PhoE